MEKSFGNILKIPFIINKDFQDEEEAVYFYKKIAMDKKNNHLLQALKNDDRVKKMTNARFSMGKLSAENLSLESISGELLVWYIWSVHKFGVDKAYEKLENVLSSDDVILLNTLWISGVSVSKSIPLECGASIVPIHELPHSCEKGFFKENYMLQVPSPLDRIPMPKSAIVIEQRRDVYNKSGEEHKRFWGEDAIVHNVAIILNLLDEIHCLSFNATFYGKDGWPPFFSRGFVGRDMVEDMGGLNFTSGEIKENQKEEIDKLISCYLKLEKDEREKLSKIILRLSQAGRRRHLEDQIIDLSVAMEMALLEDFGNNQGLALALSLRGARLIGGDFSDKKYIYETLKKIYGYRSKAVHRGAFSSGDREKAFKEIKSYFFLAKKIIRKLVLDGKPDWEMMVLGN